jgi:trehalose 6-phosphate synthase/phosphatase
MSKTIFISNRLPVTIRREVDGLKFSESIGGLATGLKSVHEDGNSLWAGWCGLPNEDLKKKDISEIKEKLSEYKSIPVFLTQNDIDAYYYGFCNNTIWPLFHYFTDQIQYDPLYWEAYQHVNKKFFNQIKDMIDDGDRIWVHDYQLFLLPKMIREAFPNTSIGFFLHIPFPSYELFRLLPWRKELLEGIMGSDLIGFHTYDYVRHFFSSVRRLLGYEHNLGYMEVGERLVRADVFPMGIDYKRYNEAHGKLYIQQETTSILEKVRGTQLVLSVDRLDYTKGIPERIKAFSEFLRKNPEYREKVTMILIVAPSRTQVDSYSELLREIQEMVGDTNGEHGTIGWVPVWFFYRALSFENLTALYAAADVMLVTPLRDGMNLVAKEYVAARADKRGMLVLSETAGAARELVESVIVNVHNIQEVADGIKTALQMNVVEKISRNTILHKRLSQYNVEFWARDFLNKLNEVEEKQRYNLLKKLTPAKMNEMIGHMKKAGQRLFMLDYDGTLTGFKDKPEDARPDKELLNLLKKLSADKNNHLVIISGRDHNNMEDWFGDLSLNLIAGHGMWQKELNGEWTQSETLSSDWKNTIRPILDVHTARTPGSFVEEKDYSLVWHYRRCEPELAAVRVSELKDVLGDLTGNLNIGFLSGNMVIEIKDTTVNKGRATSVWLNKGEWDFILAVGDDWTDEDMFMILPETAWSIKVGSGISAASYRVESHHEVRKLLKKMNF